MMSDADSIAKLDILGSNRLGRSEDAARYYQKYFTFSIQLTRY